MNRIVSKRNGVIDLMRFIFAMIIVIYHARGIGGSIDQPFFARFGYIAVEFFFVVSGFLMAKSAAHMDANTEKLGPETISFIWRKIKAILPYLLLAVVPALYYRFAGMDFSFIEKLENLALSVWDVGFLGAAGIQTFRVVRGTWYLSAMFIAMLLIYPLLRKYKNRFTHIIAPLIAITFLGYISQTYGDLNQYVDEYSLVYSGVIRAIAEISIGCICFVVSENITKKNLTLFSQILVSVFCILGYLGVVVSSHAAQAKGFDFIMLLVIAICTTLSFSKLGLLAKLKVFDSSVFSWLGKMSLVMYLNHMWVKALITEMLPKSLGYYKLLIIFVISTFVVSVLMMGIAYCLKKFWDAYGSKIKRCFIVKSEETA